MFFDDLLMKNGNFPWPCCGFGANQEQSPEILGAKIGADLVGKSQRLAAWRMDPQLGEIPSGYLTVCHGIDGPFIDGLPIKNDDSPWLC
jgi:hypothetical protein